MNSTKIVPRDIKIDSRPQVGEVFARPVGRSGKAPELHPHRQISPFLVRGGNVVRSWRSNACVGRDADHHLGFEVTMAGFRSFFINLQRLGKVDLLSEPMLHGLQVPLESVRRELKSSPSAELQVLDELVGVAAFTLPQPIGDDELGLAIHSKPQVDVSPLGRVVGLESLLLCVDKSPHLISLHVSGPDFLNMGIENGPAIVADSSHKRQDSVLMKAGQTGRCPNTHSLDNQRDRLEDPPALDVVVSDPALGQLRKGFITQRAAVALDPPTIPWVGAEALCDVPTFDAGQTLALTFFKPTAKVYEGTTTSFFGFGLRMYPAGSYSYRRGVLIFARLFTLPFIESDAFPTTTGLHLAFVDKPLGSSVYASQGVFVRGDAVYSAFYLIFQFFCCKSFAGRCLQDTNQSQFKAHPQVGWGEPHQFPQAGDCLLQVEYLYLQGTHISKAAPQLRLSALKSFSIASLFGFVHCYTPSYTVEYTGCAK